MEARRETPPASDILEGNEVIEAEAESPSPRSWEEETEPVLQEESISDQQTELAEGDAENESEQHEAEGDDKTSDDETSAQRPSSVI